MMGMFKKILVLSYRQINQICKGGVRILPGKVKRFFGQFFMNIFARLAVCCGIPWHKAYSFIGKKNLGKLKQLRLQDNPDGKEIKRIEDQTIEYFRKIVDLQSSSASKQDACRALGALYFLRGEMREMNGVLQKEADLQHAIAKEHPFNDLGMEFLPRYLAVGSIGNYEHLDIYVKAEMLGLRPPKKLILLVDPKSSINNPSFLEYWKRYVTVISDPVLLEALAPLERQLTLPLNLYMVLREKVYKSFLALGIIREQWIKEKRFPILTLSDEDYERGWQCLKSLGMKQGDWFVCLHARERGWKDNNSTAEDFRNTDISTYQLAIKSITDAGGWVLRMGDPTMKPLPEMPRVIDYAHSDLKSDWMDVFLCAQCRFFIGTSSGLFIFAMSFGIPVVITNLLPTCGAYYLTSNDLFIPRICRFKAKNRFLNFSELFSPFLGTAAVQCIYDFKNIQIIENSAEDIRGLVEEMLERCQGNFKCSEEEEELQKRFKWMTLDCGKNYGEEHSVVNARIGRSFLRKHAALLSIELKENPSSEKSPLALT